ncbi:MAG: hypothetical protein B1H13_08415 [Desulfobacteraceae bacterium 4484_190.3]|nr:MAG: hypothetical protein B1H13_08415 [Desulfobacteraceae bacterium 4484_190.3]
MKSPTKIILTIATALVVLTILLLSTVFFYYYTHAGQFKANWFSKESISALSRNPGGVPCMYPESRPPFYSRENGAEGCLF